MICGYGFITGEGRVCGDMWVCIYYRGGEGMWCDSGYVGERWVCGVIFDAVFIIGNVVWITGKVVTKKVQGHKLTKIRGYGMDRLTGYVKEGT